MAMFSQNPVLNGPNYSFADVPKDTVDGLREHRFNPCVLSSTTYPGPRSPIPKEKEDMS